MAITLDISTGQVDAGDTKTLNVHPKDVDGADVVPAALVAVFTPPTGDATTKNLGDFSLASGVYSVQFTFAIAGKWKIKITATDELGYTEVENGIVRVR